MATSRRISTAKASDAAGSWYKAQIRGASLVLLASLAATFVVVTPGSATPSPTGYDISYPQCNHAFPASPAFGIAGVNGGLPFSANPCLGTGDGPSELAWAGMDAELYANTANPGPALSSHWPNGQTTPKPCNTPSNPGSDTAECAYDYGWNASADSYQDAVDAYISLGWAPAGSTTTPVANRWWLDVEAANSWRPNTSYNVEALQGEVDYLKSVGAAGVGFYASPSDWATITGGTTSFADAPSWVPGASSLAEAEAKCGGPGPTGGGVALAQYPSAGLDADYPCSPPTAVVVRAFTERAGARGVILTWRTESEAGLLGFNLWRRGPNGAVRKLNRTLIAAKRSGQPVGATYRFVDRAARPRRFTYRLEVVSLAGARSIRG